VPGRLVAPVLLAHANPSKPFFVCLDEMNLARVEHYFSDFLSIVESRRRQDGQLVSDPILTQSQLGKIQKDQLAPMAAEALDSSGASNGPLGLPVNLYFCGTVNMDETTQPFSRKVLDRAHTLEFNDIDLMQGLDEAPTEAEVPPLDLDQSFFAPEISSLIDALPKHQAIAREIAEFLSGLNDLLDRAGFEVGYRVRDEAISFAVYAGEAGLSAEEIREAIVLQKILPRVQGSSQRIETLLLALLNKLKSESVVPHKDDPDIDDRLLALTTDDEASAVVKKIAGMLHTFREETFTSFWLA